MKKCIVCAMFLVPGLVFASQVPRVEETLSKDSKTMNVSVNIPSLFVGVIAGDVAFKVSDRMSLGPQIMYYSYGEYRGYDVGLSMNYALSDQIFDDHVWLLNPYAVYSYTDLSFDENEDGKVKKGGVIVGANLVYQWMWKSGVNLRLGFGPYFSSRKPLIDIGGSHIGAMASFSVGYAF